VCSFLFWRGLKVISVWVGLRLVCACVVQVETLIMSLSAGAQLGEDQQQDLLRSIRYETDRPLWFAVCRCYEDMAHDVYVLQCHFSEHSLSVQKQLLQVNRHHGSRDHA
jgi:hypothetical protein